MRSLFHILLLPALIAALHPDGNRPDTGSATEPVNGLTTWPVDPELVELLSGKAIPAAEPADLLPLIGEIQGRRLVLMGESTHGTSEFYRWRAALSRKLIERNKIHFIAVEGDWPGIYEINRYVKQKPGAAATALEAMDAIERWPLWMWRNHEVLELVEWLRGHNDRLPADERVGFYGVDLYAYETAADAVIEYLEEVDSGLADDASRLYGCFTRIPDIRSYLNRVALQNDHCGEEIGQVLSMLRERRQEWESRDPAAWFNAEQNAKVVQNAEKHLRANLQQGPESWNIRATHFQLTASRLLERYGQESSGAVWAHNTHIGDARATGMGQAGMVNIGQLARQEYGPDRVYAIGFGTWDGRVLAARQWEGAKEVMTIPEAQPGSWEALLGRTGIDSLLLLFSDRELSSRLQQPLMHRAIGVTYQPEMEARNNYVPTLLPERYDAFLFFRSTDILDTLD